MSISTGKQIHVYIWTEIPIIEQVIQRVDKLATREKQPDMTKGYPIFQWSLGIPIMYQEESKLENEEAPLHRNEEDDDVTEYVQGEENTEEEEYIGEEQYDYSSDGHSEVNDDAI